MSAPTTAVPATSPLRSELRHHPLGDWPLTCGHTIADAQISYLQIGTLNRERTNLVLV